MKPGLTGIGSISFRDEEAITARSSKPPERVYREDIAPYKGELELWYQQNQSFWLDLKLIFLTAWVVFRPGSDLHEKWLKGLPSRPDSLK
jgi:lipopolysaccharide/colanic/teichoic acid biosynthesis glycosyltransferase